MVDLWFSLVEALQVDLVKFPSVIFSASFLFSVILVPSCLPVSPMYIPFRIGCMEFCTPLQPFSSYQLCPSGEVKPV